MGINKNKILIHPDLFYSGHSGAIAAREAARQLVKLGYDIAIFTHDPENKEIADYRYYARVPYTGLANYFPEKYRKSFIAVINDYKPNAVFFIGAIVNTPLVYLDLCYKNKIKTVFLLLTQDFFCARFHAGLGINSCTLCLEKSNIHALKNKCLQKNRRPLLYYINYQILQKLFLPRLRKIDFVLGSTDEQLDFYQKVGIKKLNIVKIPLFFDQKRVRELLVPVNPYFVIIGQYRHEKGIHLISKILDHINDGISVKLLFYNKEETDMFLANYPENKKHIHVGKLEILPGVTMTSGAVELIAGSKGVIIPSIWATTTEFVFLEALGMSKPVITFNVGIHKEIIQNRINGICVKTGDFKAMGDEINTLNDNPDLMAKLTSESNRLYHQLTDETFFSEILNNVFQLEDSKNS